MIPQLIVLALYVLALGADLVRDGQPKDGNHSFWATLIGAIIMLLLLWWGGFFDVFAR